MTSSQGAILALDLGTKTGWAIWSLHRETVSGVISFHPSRFEGGGMRYRRFRQWLEAQWHDASRDKELSDVYFEEVRRHKGVDAAHVYGGFLATLTEWCEGHNLPYAGIPVQTIKKFISGHGNASKDKVIEAVRARGFLPQDDNEADALALLCWARAQVLS